MPNSIRPLKKLLSLAWIISLTPACANLKATFVNPPIESPVVNGSQGEFGIGLGVLPAHSYEFTNDASARPPDLESPELSPVSSPFVGGQYLFTDRLQIGLELHAFNVGVEPKLKYQLLGDKNSGLQMSLSARGGVSVNSNKGDQNGNFGPGGHEWEGKVHGHSASVGTSIGYFLNENFLFYLGGALGTQKASAEIDQKASSDGTSPAATYKTDDKADMRSFGAGVAFGSQTQVNLGFTYTEIDYEKLPTDHDTQFTVSFGF